MGWRRVIAKTVATLLTVTFSLGTSGCGEPENRSRSIEAIADEYLAALLQREPELGTTYGIPGSRHDRLPDNSLEALAVWQQREDAWLAELDRIRAPAEIGSRDWVTYGILREALAASIGDRVCRNELWSVSSATGWHSQLPAVFEIQPVDTPELRQQALDRLSNLAVYLEPAQRSGGGVQRAAVERPGRHRRKPRTTGRKQPTAEPGDPRQRPGLRRAAARGL